MSSNRMDLVSSTLDKYLKHRFNGANVTQTNGIEKPTENNSSQMNENNDHDCKLPTIHNISISNALPCCISLKKDLSFLAAGFEDSHIYLWKFDNDSSPQPQTNIEKTFRLIAHSGSVYSIEFVDNKDLMLSCSEDTTIRLWCLNTKCNVAVYRGHNYPIWSLAVGSQGLLFASASMDNTARLWQLDRITPLRIFCGHDDDVDCLKFHPNEKYIATGSSDSTVRMWSVSDGKMVRLMVGHQNPIISLSFLPNGKFLASASRDGVIKVWNLATNLVTSELSVPASFTISFSPEQKFVASCGIDSVIRLWQVGDTSLVEKKSIDFHDKSSTLIQSHFHRDNKLFVFSYKACEKGTNK